MGKLVLFLKDASPVEIPLAKERVTIGRRADNDVCLPYPAVSGEHAAVVTILADSFLEDLGSTNGTLVNGRPIAKHFLRDRDHPSRALPLFREALAFLESELPANQPRRLDALLNLARALHQTGDTVEMGQCLREAEQIAGEIYDAQHPLLAQVQEEVALYLIRIGDHAGSQRGKAGQRDLQRRLQRVVGTRRGAAADFHHRGEQRHRGQAVGKLFATDNQVQHGQRRQAVDDPQITEQTRRLQRAEKQQCTALPDADQQQAAGQRTGNAGHRTGERRR